MYASRSIGFGKAKFVEDVDGKRQALDVIMKHYGGRASAYPEDALIRTVVFKGEIEKMTGKNGNEKSSYIEDYLNP